MKFIIDKEKIKTGTYDARGLTICTCGKHRYPSKKMIYDWLKTNYSDVKGTADIWSMQDHNTGTVTITLEIKYQVPDLPKLNSPSALKGEKE